MHIPSKYFKIAASFYLIYLDSCPISFIVIILKYLCVCGCVFLAQSPWTFNSLELEFDIWHLTGLDKSANCQHTLRSSPDALQTTYRSSLI